MTERETKIRERSRAVRPAQAAPVRRDGVAMNHRDGSAVNGVTPQRDIGRMMYFISPFAGDDAE